MSFSRVGRGDLVRLLKEQPEEQEFAEIARLLGFEPSQYFRPLHPPSQTKMGGEGHIASVKPGEIGPSEGPAGASKFKPIPFFRPDHRVTIDDEPEPSSPPNPTDVQPLSFCAPTKKAPLPEPLSRWSRLGPRLEACLRKSQEGLNIDVDALVAIWSEGQRLSRIPRQEVQRWPTRLIICKDRSSSLMPIWEDQDRVVAALIRILGQQALKVCVLLGAHADELPVLSEGETVLVLGDLGSGEGMSDPWRRLGRRLQRDGHRSFALVPSTKKTLPRVEGWTSIAWDCSHSESVSPEAHLRALGRLFTLLSPAVRIEPGLLRTARRKFLKGEGDIRHELSFWRDPMVGIGILGATWRAEQAGPWRRRFEAPVDVADKEALAQLLREWHEDVLPEELWFEEQLQLEALGKALGVDLVSPQDKEALAHWGYRLQATLPSCEESILVYWRRVIGRIDPSIARDRQRGFAELSQQAARALPSTRSIAGTRIHELKRRATGPVRRFELAQTNSGLKAIEDITGLVNRDTRYLSEGIKSPVVTFESRDVAHLDVHASRAYQLSLEYSPEVSVLAGDVPRKEEPNPGPDVSWATDSGRDTFGYWAEVDTHGVRFRLRWIEPGTFMMGSPPDEAGRYEDDSEWSEVQHRVTLTRGYWMGDTPVTQVLWRSVMSDNPSHFLGETRPVENVSWDDSQRFIERLNQKYPALRLRLPTEAEWEYACRAGTHEATYGGDLSLDDNGRASELNPIAWYFANSEGKTQSVKEKAPNRLGLYDTLGNVWEWCSDWYGQYPEQTVEDPKGPRMGADRVVRGGGWFSDARYVRAASRVALEPSDRSDGVGFRVSRGPEGRTGRSPGEDPSRAEPGIARTSFESGSAIVTDRERVGMSVIERPVWAEVLGRDRFGLYAEVVIPVESQPHAIDMGPVRFRMRWIPPGSFLMGSPEDEVGRWDPSQGDGEDWSQTLHERLSPDDLRETLHPVTLSSGYWIADAPVTQALWIEVMRKNPSRFVSPTRPVEQVSFEDVESFLTQLNERVSGLEAKLPTEAQWEYACRAGEGAATYGGEMEILGVNNAPVLDAIAWYGGNAAHGFELPNGHDVSDWRERLYLGDKGGTHPVKQKTPNRWGLYDSLGNVWEWCADWVGPYAETHELDPKGPRMGASRVVRGGGWVNDARDVRAASRDALGPSDRGGSVGFRVSRGPELVRAEGSGQKLAAEPLVGSMAAEPPRSAYEFSHAEDDAASPKSEPRSGTDEGSSPPQVAQDMPKKSLFERVFGFFRRKE